jgi:chromosome segregation ATPase
MGIGEWLSKNFAVLTALAAVAMVAVNMYLAFLKRQSDSVDSVTRIVKTSTDLLKPLEDRVNELERDNTKFKQLADRQSGQIDQLQTQNETQNYELRAIRADRNNLLQRVLNLQNENEHLKTQIDDLRPKVDALGGDNERQKILITRLEGELAEWRVSNGKSEDIDDRSSTSSGERSDQGC